MRRIAVGLIVAVLATTACGGDDKPAANDAAQAPATTVAPTDAPIASTAPAAVPSASAAAADTAGGTATCEFLQGELSSLKIGSAKAARARLRIGYFSFVDLQPGTKPADFAELDAMTTRDCPDVRDEALKLIEAPAFAGTL